MTATLWRRSNAKGRPIRVAVLVPLFPPAQLGGGPIRSLSALVAQQPDAVQSLVFTSDRDLDGTRLQVVANSVLDAPHGHTYFASTDRHGAMVRGLRTIRRYRPNMIYVNGFFNLKFSILIQLLASVRLFRGAKLLLAPRGEFSCGALGLKPAKKRRYLRAYRWLRLDRQVLWHASSQRERDDILHVIGAQAQVLVRENETTLPEIAQAPVTPPGNALRLAYVGRITEMKGLHLLLEGLKATTSRIDLVVFGSPEDRVYFAKCEQLMSSLPPNVHCDYKGWLDSDEVRETLATFELLAQPTAGENFGHVLAESLSVSCPVACADVTPWSPVLRDGGGIVLDSRSAAVWTKELEHYASLSAGARLARRRAAGHAYEAWRTATKQRHVFELALDAFIELRAPAP